MKNLVALLLLLITLLAGVAFYQHRPSPTRGAAAPLTVYCAASLRKSLEAIAEHYRQDTGTEVRLQFGGSGTLLSSLRVARQGDLYLPVDEGSVSDARQAGVVREVFPIAVQRPIIAVRKGNPKGIHTLDDLLRGDVKTALANPEAASISRVSRKALGEKWTQLAAHATVMKPTVTEVAADVNLGTVDAGIIWDTVTAQFEGTQAIQVPELSGIHENASACVLTFSAQPNAALRFAHYLTAPDKGGTVFQANGFTPAGGEKWASQ
jgi:molybdate transport system substrate-binding protein